MHPIPSFESPDQPALSEFEDVLDELMQQAGKLLRSKSAEALLTAGRDERRVLVWQAYFQAIFSPTFGTLAPGDGWRAWREELIKVRGKMANSVRLSRRPGKVAPPLYLVAQFWNADDERATAFVVDEQFAGTNSALAGTQWENQWAVMAAVNSDTTPADGSGHMLRLRSLGNFVVCASRETSAPCDILAFCVGFEEQFQKFQARFWGEEEERGRFFTSSDAVPEQEVLDEYFRSLSRQERADFLARLEVPNEFARLLLERFTTATVGLDAKKAAQNVWDISRDPLWDRPELARYLKYVECFFRWKYRAIEITQPTVEDIKTILLNNVGITRLLVNAGIKTSCQYFFPTFHRSTSYLALGTDELIDDRTLKVYSRFAERLFGLAWAHDSVRKLDQDKTAILERTEQAARAAIMSRNLSHNIGSHVLANPRLASALRLDGALESRRELETFHQYMQARLDFLARAISRQAARFEPLFFVGEMLNGFFRQTVVLETLLADRGFPLAALGQALPRSIRFHLKFDLAHLTKRRNYTYMYEMSAFNSARYFKLAGVTDASGAAIEDATGEDILIGVPGGMIGCQAMYSLLENIMRNAAKYGRHRNAGKNLEIFLSLRDATRCDTPRYDESFLLEMWDSLSDDGEGDADGGAPQCASARKVRGFIDDEIILSSGEINPDGHGIQEMKIAAGILSNGQCFSTDGEALEVEPEEANAYTAFLRRPGIERCVSERPIRAFSEDRGVRCPKDGPTMSLVYQVLISKARLVGVVMPGPPDRAHPRPGAGTQAIWYYSSIHELARGGAAFGVLLDLGQDMERAARSDQVPGGAAVPAHGRHRRCRQGS